MSGRASAVVAPHHGVLSVEDCKGRGALWVLLSIRLVLVGWAFSLVVPLFVSLSSSVHLMHALSLQVL